MRFLCEPDATNYEASAQLFVDAGLPPPPNEPDLEKLLADHGAELDTAFIITPHNLHFTQAELCLRAGLDVLLEKPMVLDVAEAEALIRARDETGRLLVVAFNGSLSPYIYEARKRIERGELGELRSISATIWQNWDRYTDGTWRQVPEISGGGFLFDTGAHMLNTAALLAGEGYSSLSAWLEDDGHPVEMRSVINARTASGLLVTMHGCGTTVGIGSEVFVFGTRGLLQTGAWGRRLAWPGWAMYSTRKPPIMKMAACGKCAYRQTGVSGSASCRFTPASWKIPARPSWVCAWRAFTRRSWNRPCAAAPRSRCRAIDACATILAKLIP